VSGSVLVRAGRVWVAVFILLVVQVAWAGGPRWVTGPPYFTTAGVSVVWYTDAPKYYTDPGSLSPWVDHASADALVAAAAGVWNVPTARLVLAQGGSLDEHVSGANAYTGSAGVVLPADVQASNYAAKQIAVIYDHDGSVTDLLLGVGASDPSGCRQNAVTESVDLISKAGFIQHAVLVLNGRCTGTAPEMQLQMQYQLMRAFGRVLGLAWSQTNDNVFTQSPAPTYQQAMHWPVMHPIDIVCGPYTYQCMPQPFTLRDDDVAALSELYFIDKGTAAAGKVDTLLNANEISGRLSFPSGQGMQGVNVVGRRLQQYWNIPEDWETNSSVTGFLFRRTSKTPVLREDTLLNGSMGTTDGFYEGWYKLARVPMLPGDWQQVIMETQPVNPLYIGQYSLGPYVANTVNPSGLNASQVTGIYPSYSRYGWIDVTTNGPAGSCNTGGGGTESAPAVVASSGWWTGVLCGYGHVAWSGLAMKAKRSLTVEVTAQDEGGFATTAKAMPVIGVWRAADALGTLPGMAAATSAFNGTSAGMTSLTVQSVQPESLRMVIADERGDGRPDFGYGARVLYADAVSPASVSAGGGVVTITGMGFRAGNVVTVNGAAAAVSSWTPNAIVATVPASGTSAAMAADVVVTDTSSGGTTVMTGALTYAAPVPEVMTLVSAPSGTVYVGDVAATAFAVRVMKTDGVTPVAGEAVVFSAASGGVKFGSCGVGSCTVVTDAAGVATSFVTPVGAGLVVLSATGISGGVAGSFTAVARVRTTTMEQPVEYVPAGATVNWQPAVVLADNSAGTAGVGVNWRVTAGPMALASGVTVADGQGLASAVATVGPLAGGEQATGQVCAWVSVCAGFSAVGVGAATLQVDVVSGAGQSEGVSGVLGPVVLRVTDGAGHVVSGAAVEVHQSVEGGTACAGRGRCPVAPVLGSDSSEVVSDASGLVTVVPEQVADVAEVTNVAVAVGTQGFCSLALLKGQ
jgi:hypothetical protein